MMMATSSMANMAVQLPPSSYHPGGVNLMFGDGSVRFIKEYRRPQCLAGLEHAERRRSRERLGLLIDRLTLVTLINQESTADSWNTVLDDTHPTEDPA